MKTVLQLNSYPDRSEHTHSFVGWLDWFIQRSQINNEKVNDMTFKRIVRQRTNDYVSDNISLVGSIVRILPLSRTHTYTHRHSHTYIHSYSYIYNIVAKIQFTIKVQPHCSIYNNRSTHTQSEHRHHRHQLNVNQIRYTCIHSHRVPIQKKIYIFISVDTT